MERNPALKQYLFANASRCDNVKAFVISHVRLAQRYLHSANSDKMPARRSHDKRMSASVFLGGVLPLLLQVTLLGSTIERLFLLVESDQPT